MIKDLENLVKKSETLLPSEDLFIEAMRDLMKEEIKEYLKEQMNSNPEVKEAIRRGMLMYIEAKIKESEAETVLIKALSELGVLSLPPEMREKIMDTMYKTFKKEIDEIIEKTI